jgi:hypothetical protein
MPWWTAQENVIKVAEYGYQKWLSSPMIERALQLAAESAEAGRAAELAAGIARIRAASLLIGTAELALTLGVPIAAWVGMFAAMGAPYAQARGLVRRENFKSGFSQGFVMALLKWEWHHAVARFGRFSPGQPNPFDESLSYERANSYNAGLKAGFTHAHLFNEDARKATLAGIKKLAHNSAPSVWNRNTQISYVIELAAAAIKNNFFRTN